LLLSLALQKEGCSVIECQDGVNLSAQLEPLLNAKKGKRVKRVGYEEVTNGTGSDDNRIVSIHDHRCAIDPNQFSANA